MKNFGGGDDNRLLRRAGTLAERRQNAVPATHDVVALRVDHLAERGDDELADVGVRSARGDHLKGFHEVALEAEGAELVTGEELNRELAEAVDDVHGDELLAVAAGGDEVAREVDPHLGPHVTHTANVKLSDFDELLQRVRARAGLRELLRRDAAEGLDEVDDGVAREVGAAGEDAVELALIEMRGDDFSVAGLKGAGLAECSAVLSTASPSGLGRPGRARAATGGVLLMMARPLLVAVGGARGDAVNGLGKDV